ncbi:MAG: BrnT family toxin [Deltaproteobacteria bacterium]|nr:BrnT family toxin [Deltaproteobacteria bacterium]
MELTFEWDPRKAVANSRKHGVSFEQAIPVFGDSLARIFDDPDQTANEPRELIVGHCARRLLLVVCFIQRDDRIRIFSARRATRRERRDYEEGR